MERHRRQQFTASGAATWPERCRVVAADARFQNTVLALILANAAVLGLETSPPLAEEFGGVFGAFHAVVGALFAAELAVRLVACWPAPAVFFRDRWNVFDFVVVTSSLLPAVGALATVARTARLLRVARVVTALPELRLIVATMLRSVASMGHIAVLLGLLLYVYALVGVRTFGETDPARWGGLGTALLTLFQILTLEGWVEAQAATLKSHPWAWTYFASFIVIAVFVVVNLFIAVVINNLEAAKEQEGPGGGPRGRAREDDVLRQLETLRLAVDRLDASLKEPYGSRSRR